MIKTEQRQFRRYETRQLLDYLVMDEQGNPGEYSMATTLDVSCDGLRLETVQPIEPNTTLKITMELEDILVDLEAKTTNTGKNQEKYVAGVNFIRMSKDGRRALVRYIETLQ